MRTNSLQIPLNFIALSTHTKILITFFIENQDILKNGLILDTAKADTLAKLIKPFIKSIADIWKDNEMLISAMQSKIIDKRSLYPQRDRRYQRTNLQINLTKKAIDS